VIIAGRRAVEPQFAKYQSAPVVTRNLKLIGAHGEGRAYTVACWSRPVIRLAGWSLQLPTSLFRLGFPQDVAEHLAHNYGDKAFEVAELAKQDPSLQERLADGAPRVQRT
jgi:hypothetical protein